MTKIIFTVMSLFICFSGFGQTYQLILLFKDNQSQTRIPSFADGDQNIILTTLLTGKKENKIKSKDVNRALGIREDYFDRRDALLGRRSAQARAKRG